MSIPYWANILRTTCWYLKNIKSCAHLLSKCWSPFFWTGVKCPSDCILCLLEGFVAGREANDRAAMKTEPSSGCAHWSPLIRIESYQFRSFQLSFWSSQFLIFSNWGTPTPSSPPSTQSRWGAGVNSPNGVFLPRTSVFLNSNRFTINSI